MAVLPRISVEVCSGIGPCFSLSPSHSSSRSLVKRTAQYGGSRLKECEINNSLVQPASLVFPTGAEEDALLSAITVCFFFP